jgi:hypothetical protein
VKRGGQTNDGGGGGRQRVEFQSLALFGFSLVRDPAAPQAQLASTETSGSTFGGIASVETRIR